MKAVKLSQETYRLYQASIPRYLANPKSALIELFGLTKCHCRNGQPCQIDAKQMEIVEEFTAIAIAKLKRGKNAQFDQELARKLGVLVQSAKGTGKTAIAAMIVILFMYLFPNCKIFIVGPKEDQIKTGIWPEIAKWLSHSMKVYGDNHILNVMFRQEGKRFFSRAFIEDHAVGKRWFTSIMTFPKSADPEEQKAAIQGKHEDYMLFVLEECPGIPDSVYEAIESTCTDILGVNMVVGIFNPNKNTGWAIKEFNNGYNYTPIQISAFDSSLVSKDHIERIRLRYGEDSTPYRVSVLGLPPLNSSDGAFPWDWLIRSQEAYDNFQLNKEAPVVFGCDIGMGGDLTVLCARQGAHVLGFFEFDSNDSRVISDWIFHKMQEFRPKYVIIDRNGVGQGVYDNLKDFTGVTPFISHDAAYRPDKFNSMRDELLYRLRERLERLEIFIKDNESDDLKGELSVLKFVNDTKDAKITFTSKSSSEFKKELRGAVGYDSPNRSDALYMTLLKEYSPGGQVDAYNKSNLWRGFGAKSKPITPLGWMA